MLCHILPCAQPMMMPLLSEMPCGRAGVAMMERVVQATLFGEHL